MNTKYLNPDWMVLIKEIREARPGWSYRDIQDKTGLPQYTVSDVKTGRCKFPIYTTGAALVHLHERVTRKKR